jgi:hypothetical protein
MITVSKCKKLGLEKQFKKLYEKMRDNHKKFIPDSALEKNHYFYGLNSNA